MGHSYGTQHGVVVPNF